MCSQFNSSSSSSSSSFMVLPKCNFLSSRPFLDFHDGCQNSPPQDTQEEAHQLAHENQNEEDDRQQQQQRQQQEEDNNKKEEEVLFEGNVKDYNNNDNKFSVIPQVGFEEGRVLYTDSTPTFEKDNVKNYSTKIIPTSPECVSTSRQMMICPPAPKKKKAIQVAKRKLHFEEERVFVDVYDEVESFYPPALLADLDNKIKKARKINFIL